ncbi:MAG: peptidase U32 family protein [Dysgonomonas sp.]
MIKARKIELLAPAKNLECGIEAINHGADAVYIGAPKFSARSAAGNTLDDIKTLTEYAHQFNARIYVALNTILKDSELTETEKLIWKLYDIGVDALIVQDLGILMLDLPPIPLHASTQTDNRNVEKIKFFEQAGFSQVVLARELSLNEIKNISENTNVTLEAFVHGALCVSYSGQCYLSEAITRRSANRGSCAQLCRLPYKLIDSEEKVVTENKHLLSMKDLNLSDQLEGLIEAGVSSLKIEGRLKDVSYVKNVTAYYRQKLDQIFSRRTEFQRSSSGNSTYSFKPDITKSFNRGFTQYFHNGRVQNIWSVDSPKSTGEPIGRVKNVFDRFFVLSGTKKINNGDGLCFFDSNMELKGIRVNRVEGENIFPAEHNISVKKGTLIYRNFDHEFEKTLSKKSAERKIDIQIILKESHTGFTVDAEDEDGNNISLHFDQVKEIANKDQTDNIKSIFSKTGNTIFNVEKVELMFSNNWFIPASVLSEWKRTVTDQMLIQRKNTYFREIVHHKPTDHPFPVRDITYLGNVMNEKSKQFFIQHKSVVKEMAFEKESKNNIPLMFTRHCIKYSLGYCPKERQENFNYKEPLYLVYNGTKLILEFDCKICEMRVIEA